VFKILSFSQLSTAGHFSVTTRAYSVTLPKHSVFGQFTDLSTGGVIVTQNFLDTMGRPSTEMISTTTAIYDIGCFFGAISICKIGDPLGRKRAILLGTTIMSIGAIIQIASFSVAQMIVGR
jgi:MFS family permease